MRILKQIFDPNICINYVLTMQIIYQFDQNYNNL